MVSWQALLFVGLGGFFGANVRYILSFVLTEGIAKLTGWRLPFGTAFVNITGSFLLAVFLYWAGRRAGFPDSVRLLVGTGFFGAYTTFSTYANESINLILGGEWRSGLVYVLGTNALCFIGVVFGLQLASRLWPV